MKNKWVFMPLLLLGFAAFVLAGGLAVRLLWNWLLPPLVNVPEVTFWQALGILALSRILFGGFGGRGGHPGVRRRMSERWERMTPDERERFRQGVRGRCDSGPSTSESKGQ